MKELIKPSFHQETRMITTLCEVDCACPHVYCNKDCDCNPGGNTSIREDQDILF
jgi:hypothetical protein